MATQPELNQGLRAPLPSFWRGGFLQLGGAFCAGVLLTLMVIGAAVTEAGAAERTVGKCQVACRERGFQLSQANGTACSCAKFGAPNKRVAVDPDVRVCSSRP